VDIIKAFQADRGIIILSFDPSYCLYVAVSVAVCHLVVGGACSGCSQQTKEGTGGIQVRDRCADKRYRGETEVLQSSAERSVETP